jgi:hypothetical protein
MTITLSNTDSSARKQSQRNHGVTKKTGLNWTLFLLSSEMSRYLAQDATAIDFAL